MKRDCKYNENVNKYTMYFDFIFKNGIFSSIFTIKMTNWQVLLYGI